MASKRIYRKEKNIIYLSSLFIFYSENVCGNYLPSTFLMAFLNMDLLFSISDA